MFLEEIEYQIQGTLTFSISANLCIIVLLGTDQKICSVEEWSETELLETNLAVGNGKTEEEARIDLVNALKGKLLKYRYPMHGTTYEGFLLIPSTLVGDKTEDKIEVIDVPENIFKERSCGPSCNCVDANALT